MSLPKKEGKFSRVQVCFLIPIVLALLLFASGCPVHLLSGNYNGDLSIHDVKDLEDLHLYPVQIQIRQLKPENRWEVTKNTKRWQLSFMDFQAEKKLPEPFLISNITRNGFDLKVPDLQDEPFHLKRVVINSKKNAQDQTRQCFIGKTEYFIEICNTDQNIIVDIKYQGYPRIYFYGTLFGNQQDVVLETPKRYTVTDAINLALARNLDIQGEKYNLVIARQAAKAAYLSLLPKIDLAAWFQATAAVMPYVTPFTALPAVGDFISFAFPNRWMDAKKKKLQGMLENVTYTLLKANTATSIQILAIHFLNHQEIHKELGLLREQMIEFIKAVQFAQDKKKLPEGTIRVVNNIFNEVDQAFIQAEDQIVKDAINIAQVLGLENPDAVTDMELGNETTTLDKIRILEGNELKEEKKKYEKLAELNSFELRQQDYLKRQVCIDKNEIFVQWLDFAATTSSHLGFDTIPQDKIAAVTIDQVNLKIRQIRRDLKSKAATTVHDRNWNMRNLKIYENSLNNRREILNDILSPVLKFKTGEHLEALLPVGGPSPAPLPTLPIPLPEPTLALPVLPQPIPEPTFPKPLSEPLPSSTATGQPDNGKSQLALDTDKLDTAIQSIITDITKFYNTRAVILMDQAMLDRFALRGPYQILEEKLQLTDEEIFSWSKDSLAKEELGQKDDFKMK